VRRALIAIALALLLAGPAHAYTRQEVTLPMDDGVSLAGTLYLPDATPPAGGFPAIVVLHGLGGDRRTVAPIAEFFATGDRYVVLAYDARGHGQSGGVVDVQGPRDVADVRAVHAWLTAREDVADARIGAWGISYGGGGVLNSLAAGVPWAAAEVVETWTDLAEALIPQGLAKSGVIGVFSNAIPAGRRSPELDAAQAAAFAGNLGPARAFAAPRSSIGRLRGIRTPIFFMQGRRDFAFGIEQATRAFAAVSGPKRLWLGNHGHSPSRFPAADTTAMLAEGREWFDRFLAGEPNGIDRRPPVVIAEEGSARVRRLAALPRPRIATTSFARGATIPRAGKATFTTAPLRATVEVFGAPTVRVRVRNAAWPRLVAVLTARAPGGREIVVSTGGAPLRGPGTVTISLVQQVTRVPKGSRYTVTLAASSTAQHPSNLLYLDLPGGSGALRVDRVTLRVPELTR
jgi:predicted acyl esterase